MSEVIKWTTCDEKPVEENPLNEKLYARPLAVLNQAPDLYLDVPISIERGDAEKFMADTNDYDRVSNYGDGITNVYIAQYLGLPTNSIRHVYRWRLDRIFLYSDPISNGPLEYYTIHLGAPFEEAPEGGWKDSDFPWVKYIWGGYDFNLLDSDE